MKGNVARRVGRVIISGPWGARQKAVGSRLVRLPECSAKKQEEKIAISLFHKEQLDIFSHLQLTRGKGKMRLTFFPYEHPKSKIPKTCHVPQKNAALVLQTVQLFRED